MTELSNKLIPHLEVGEIKPIIHHSLPSKITRLIGLWNLTRI